MQRLNRNFEESYACRSGVHCAICRDREGGREWRRGLRAVYRVPADDDFECPRGKLWGETNADADSPRQVAAAVREPESTQSQYKPRDPAACEDCPHFTELDHGRPACRLLLDAFGRTPLPCQYARLLRGEIPPPAGCPHADKITSK